MSKAFRFAPKSLHHSLLEDQRARRDLHRLARHGAKGHQKPLVAQQRQQIAAGLPADRIDRRPDRRIAGDQIGHQSPRAGTDAETVAGKAGRQIEAGHRIHR